jgi:pyruvate,orthophosphate dikinase
MNDEVANGFSRLARNERFVYDAYRRFITMFANVVMGAERKLFDDLYEAEKRREKVKTDPELSAAGLKNVVETQKRLYRKEVGSEFPMDPYQQLKLAIAAVFNSWNTPRAITYRKIEGIPDAMGTACNIQTMVFGNLGDDSGSGVLFTRDPTSGEKNVVGEILFNAQGEDVVAGLRTPLNLSDLKKQYPNIHEELVSIVVKLERHYRDMQDIEFTIERGILYMLQTRSA